MKNCGLRFHCENFVSKVLQKSQYVLYFVCFYIFLGSPQEKELAYLSNILRNVTWNSKFLQQQQPGLGCNVTVSNQIIKTKKLTVIRSVWRRKSQAETYRCLIVVDVPFLSNLLTNLPAVFTQCCISPCTNAGVLLIIMFSKSFWVFDICEKVCVSDG